MDFPYLIQQGEFSIASLLPNWGLNEIVSFSKNRRKPREGEVDGVSYHYVDVETIQQAIENDEFIEHATFSGNTYGTSKAAVRTVVEEGKICILDIVSF